MTIFVNNENPSFTLICRGCQRKLEYERSDIEDMHYWIAIDKEVEKTVYPDDFETALLFADLLDGIGASEGGPGSDSIDFAPLSHK